jgi:hypothetical protein
LENRELLRIAAKASRISWVVQTLAATHDGQRMIGVTLAGIRQVKIESNLQRASTPRGFRRRARRSIVPRMLRGRVNTANLREHGGNFNGHCWTLRRLRATSEILGICSIAHFPPR